MAASSRLSLSPPLNSPIRVVHLVNTLNTGGLERVVLDLVRYADRSQVQPQVACLLESGDLHDRFVDEGVSPHSLGLRGGTVASRAVKLAKFLRRSGAEVLHTHNSGPHVVGAIAAVLARVPVLVHTKHGRNYVDRPRAVMANRFASYLSSHVVAVSHDAAEVARKIEKVPERLISVVHNGVDIEAFSCVERSRLPNKVTRAIHVARLNRVKDQATLLRAAKIVADQEPGFTLDIVGDGPARAELEQLYGELQLHGRVNFLGMRNDVPALLAEADFFVLSSISEGISLTLLEAMAAELAIVATDVGGNGEVVEQQRTGLLAPARKPEALADAMLHLIRNPTECRRWGVAGRERVKGLFNIESAVDQYQALYAKLLVAKKPKRRPPKAASSQTKHAGV